MALARTLKAFPRQDHFAAAAPPLLAGLAAHAARQAATAQAPRLPITPHFLGSTRRFAETTNSVFQAGWEHRRVVYSVYLMSVVIDGS